MVNRNSESKKNRSISNAKSADESKKSILVLLPKGVDSKESAYDLACLIGVFMSMRDGKSTPSPEEILRRFNQLDAEIEISVGESRKVSILEEVLYHKTSLHNLKLSCSILHLIFITS